MGHEAKYQLRKSAHFRIEFLPNPFAQRNVARVEERLERVWAAVSTLLDVDLGDPITIRLDDALGPMKREVSSSDALMQPHAREVHIAYRADAPGVDLERAVLHLTLAKLIEHDPVPFLLDGLVGHVARLNPGAMGVSLQSRLAITPQRGGFPPLTALFLGPKSSTRTIYAFAALSFVDFLLNEYGPDKFKQFLRLLVPGQGPAAARAAFGCSMQELEKAWRKAMGKRKGGGILRFLMLITPYLRPYRRRVAEITIYTLIAVAFGVGFARVQGYLLDHALLPRNGHVLAITMGTLGIAFAIVIAGQIRASYLLATTSGRVLQDIRLRMFTLVQRLDPGSINNFSTGDILSRMTADLDQVQSGVPVVLAQGIRMILTVLVAVIVIFTLNWKLACLSLVSIPLFVLSGRVFGPRAAAASIKRQQNLARSITTLQEDLSAQPIVKVFGLEEWTTRRYTQDLVELFRSGVHLTFVTGVSAATLASIASLTQLAVLGIGGYLVVQGQLSPGSLFAFVALMAQIIVPMQNLSGVLQTVQQASGGMERVQELLQAEPRIVDSRNASDAGRLSSSIRLEDVSFSYTGTEPNLQRVTLDIVAGSTVAIVGPSGCGKSTLLNMLLRFYDPDEGCIRFDGTDLRQLTLYSLRSQIGMVPQDSVLFNISIRENIRLGSLTASDEEVEAAARVAEIHHSIVTMPEGYDTLAGERGGQLSGGQRQRVAIARAVIRDPSILLLDEASSALDARTEAAITETLERVGQGRTTIAVTHRLASTAGVDCIVVMDRGRIIETGTHAELIERNGLYASLWREQAASVVEGASAGISRLRRIPIFAQLPTRLLESLAEQLYVQRFRSGETIIEQGEIGEELYIIRKGQVDVLVSDSAGRDRCLATLREGDHFGEIALLHDAPRSATVKSRTQVEAYSLGKQEFVSLLAAEPELRAILERVISERMARVAT